MLHKSINIYKRLIRYLTIANTAFHKSELPCNDSFLFKPSSLANIIAVCNIFMTHLHIILKNTVTLSFLVIIDSFVAMLLEYKIKSWAKAMFFTVYRNIHIGMQLLGLQRANYDKMLYHIHKLTHIVPENGFKCTNLCIS